MLLHYYTCWIPDYSHYMCSFQAIPYIGTIPPVRKQDLAVLFQGTILKNAERYTFPSLSNANIENKFQFIEA